MLQGSSLTSMTGVTTGTPAYMAPEQVTGHEVGPAADRYSLATIAYEMLTGSIPFQGQGVIELLYAHVHLDPALPSSLEPELNQSVDAVIMRGLAKEPRSRWGSCEAFVTALGAALGAKSVAATIDRTVDMAPPVERIDSTLPFAAPPTTVPSPVWPPIVAAARRKSRRQRLVIVAIAVLALLALVAGVVGFIFRDAFTPTLSLSSPTVAAGSILMVSARNLPRNQDGEIHLQSELFQFPFRTDSRGNLNEAIVIPLDIGLGDHHILLCWSSSCPLQVPLKVAAGASPTQNASPAPLASITLVSISAIGKTKVVFHNFDAGSATVYVYQNGSAHPSTGIVVNVPAGTDSTVIFNTPRGVLPALGNAYVRACGSRCFDSKPIKVGR
jgi:hypothetical protein